MLSNINGIVEEIQAAEESFCTSFATDSLSEAVFPSEPLESLSDIKRDHLGEYIERDIVGQCRRFYVSELATERRMLSPRSVDSFYPHDLKHVLLFFFHHSLIDTWDSTFIKLMDHSAQESGLLGCRLNLTPSKNEILEIMKLIHSRDGLCEKILMHRFILNKILDNWPETATEFGKMESKGKAGVTPILGAKAVISARKDVFRDVYAFRTCPDFLLSYRSHPRISVKITGSGVSMGCSFRFIRAVTDFNGVARLKLAKNAEEVDDAQEDS